MESRILSNCLKVVRGLLRQNATQMEKSNDIRIDSLRRVLLRRTMLTTMRPFLLFQKRTLLELSWPW